MDDQPKDRTDWVDYAKGIGIILVVYAHLLSSAYHGGIQVPEHFFALSDSIVYSFHMPFFFFLSGLFVESSLQKRGARDYLIDKFARLAYPYFIWSILQVSVEAIFSSQTQMGATAKDVLAIPYQPWGQFWFLYALFLMHVAHVILSRSGRFSTGLMVLAGLGLFFFPVLSSRFALAGFTTHFLFFTGGIALRKFLDKSEAWMARPIFALASMACFFGAAYYVFEYLIEPARLSGNPNRLHFLFLSALGIAAGTALSMYLAGTKRFQVLQILGRYSLPIYLVHMLAGVGLRVILLSLFNLQNWIVHILAGVLFALLAPIALQILSTKVNFPYLFEWKVSRRTELQRN
jgi:fucose 4-O-acetylase-like acetyltransferase